MPATRATAKNRTARAPLASRAVGRGHERGSRGRAAADRRSRTRLAGHAHGDSPRRGTGAGT
eukprot:6530602-Prymnesium_polylepis.1